MGRPFHVAGVGGTALGGVALDIVDGTWTSWHAEHREARLQYVGPDRRRDNRCAASVLDVSYEIRVGLGVEYRPTMSLFCKLTEVITMFIVSKQPPTPKTTDS